MIRTTPVGSNLSFATTFHERLQLAAQPYRDRLDARLPLLDPHLTLETYRSVLQRFYGFYMPLEAAMESSCVSALHEDMARRRKTAWLVQDLLTLKDTPQAIAGLPLCPDLPSLDSHAQWLGALYAVEGLTLDGRLIARYLRHQFGADARRCCRFFLNYGSHVRLMWDVLLDNLELAAVRPDHERAIVDSACRTLQCFDRWLAADGHSHVRR